MTNLEIIMGEMILNNINLDLKVDTFAGWKRKGFTVKRGEHAVFQTRIWKPRKKGKQEEPEQDTEDKKEKHGNLVLVKASFFTEEQVEKQEVKND